MFGRDNLLVKIPDGRVWLADCLNNSEYRKTKRSVKEPGIGVFCHVFSSSIKVQERSPRLFSYLSVEFREIFNLELSILFRDSGV